MPAKMPMCSCIKKNASRRISMRAGGSGSMRIVPEPEGRDFNYQIKQAAFRLHINRECMIVAGGDRKRFR